VDQFKELCRIPVEYSFDPAVKDIPLSPETQVQALRIVQEALSNTRKHSKASQASVQILFHDQELVLVIEDNGLGFDPAAPSFSRRSQYGLQTMRERAESLHGKFMIESHPGKGTRITVSLPISLENAA
jgi:signal transduction histidine kinase